MEAIEPARGTQGTAVIGMGLERGLVAPKLWKSARVEICITASVSNSRLRRPDVLASISLVDKRLDETRTTLASY
jgi:hypothetical protein